MTRRLRVHVEGMGVTGSLLAYQLERLKYDWSWHDVDAPVTAWKACTGSIFPAGKPGSLDDQCYQVWDRWAGPVPLEPRGGLVGAALRIAEQPYPARFLETGSYWFSTKSAPHGGSYQFDGPSQHGLRCARPFSYHLNAQKFVPATRKHFIERHWDKPDKGDVYVVAHGFGDRLHHVLWGWAVPVKLRYADYYAQAGNRPCFYFREGRFVMAYAYPIPGTEWWYAGSSLIVQRVPKALEVQPKYERWKKTFERLSGGAVKVVDRGAELVGWRPAEGGAHVDPLVKRSTRRFVNGSVIQLSVPPLWHSGIRHFPRVWQQLQTELVKLGEGR
jgi:hypothetical protein